MQNKTALIVDDSRTACQMLRLMLEREEFQVDVLDNPEQAVGYLRDHRPGVIFMDHLMPGMEGYNAVKEIKSNSLASQIPIVMYTAKSGELYVGQAQALGDAGVAVAAHARGGREFSSNAADQRRQPGGATGEVEILNGAWCHAGPAHRLARGGHDGAEIGLQCRGSVGLGGLGALGLGLGSIMGLGIHGYELAVEAIARRLAS